MCLVCFKKISYGNCCHYLTSRCIVFKTSKKVFCKLLFFIVRQTGDFIRIGFFTICYKSFNAFFEARSNCPFMLTNFSKIAFASAFRLSFT